VAGSDHRREGWELAVGLLTATSALFGELHARLAQRGHPALRPAHGYAFQAIGPAGATASELAERLSVTKQAAGQMTKELVGLGYLSVGNDASDARRRPLLLTPRGHDALEQTVLVFDQLRSEWAQRAGEKRLERAADALETLSELYGRGGPLRPVW
jgi:DNA-binding MarR family transcriptional regulator